MSIASNFCRDQTELRTLHLPDTFQLSDTYSCHSDDINLINKINVTRLIMHLFSTSVQFLPYTVVLANPRHIWICKSKDIVGSSFLQFLLFLSFFSTNSFSSLIYTSPSSIPNNSYSFFFSPLLLHFIYSQLFVLLTMLQLSLLLGVMLFFSSESWNFNYYRLLG